MGSPQERPRHTVLVVDDDEYSRDIIRRTLHAEHHVLLAETGARALEILDANPVDLVLLDVMLPETPGFEICRQVKTRTRDAYLPILLLSALDEQSDRNAGLAAGADDYLTKPFDRNELRLRVNMFLGLRDRENTHRSEIDATRRVQHLKDDLVALIAHDLRNPLMGIQGNLELLQNLTAAPEFGSMTARVKKAIASTGELRAILDGLLDVKLLEEQRLPVHAEPASVRALLEHAIAALEGAAAAKSVTIELQVDGPPEAALDRRLMLRALENLLSNAIRHTASGSCITVSGSNGPGGLSLAVADRGEGVLGDLKRELFQKFGGSSAAAGGARRGYGLGLYLVRLVAEAHGGNAQVADREGGGAVFTITLPRGPRSLSSTP